MPVDGWAWPVEPKRPPVCRGCEAAVEPNKLGWVLPVPKRPPLCWGCEVAVELPKRDAAGCEEDAPNNPPAWAGCEIGAAVLPKRPPAGGGWLELPLLPKECWVSHVSPRPRNANGERTYKRLAEPGLMLRPPGPLADRANAMPGGSRRSRYARNGAASGMCFRLPDVFCRSKM